MNVLILARDVRWYGGVVNFVQQLMANLSTDVKATQFVMGQRKSGASWIPTWMTPLSDAFRLWRQVRCDRYDAYHINPSLDGKALLRDGLFLVVLKLVGAKRVVIAFHGWEQSIQDMLTRNPLLRRLFGWVYGDAGAVVVLAPQFRDWLVRVCGFPADHVHLFTTMFDPRQFDGLRRCRNDGPIRLLFMSRLVKEKGIYELLEAVSIAANQRKDVRLICAGDGPEMGNIRQQVDDGSQAEQVTLVGYLRGKSKGQVLLDADIFVLPSYAEGCPVAILEAMAAGLPVITTPVGGIPGIIRDGENGILLKDVKPATIATAVAALIEDPALRRRMGDQNRKEAWEKYAALMVARRFEAFYLGAAGSV